MSNIRPLLRSEYPSHSPKDRYAEPADEWDYGSANHTSSDVVLYEEEPEVFFESINIADKKHSHVHTIPFQLTKTFNQLQASHEEVVRIPREAISALVPHDVVHYNTRTKELEKVQSDKALICKVSLENVVNTSPFTIDIHAGKRTGIKGNFVTSNGDKALFRIYPNTAPGVTAKRVLFKSTFVNEVNRKHMNDICDIADCNPDSLSSEVQILGDGCAYTPKNSRLAFVMKRRPDLFFLAQSPIQDTLRVDLKDVSKAVAHVRELQSKLDYADFNNFEFYIRNANGGVVGDVTGTDLEKVGRSPLQTVEGKQYTIAFDLKFRYVYPRIDKRK